MIGLTHPSLEAMLQHLYASVLDPTRFEDFAADLRLAMNAHLVALQSDDPSHHHSVQKHFCDRPLDIPAPDYANDASVNLYFVRGADAFSIVGIIDGTTLFAPGELQRTAFHREVLMPLDVHYSMGFCLAAEPSGQIHALSVSRDRKRPPFEPDAMQLAKRLLPHLRNVYQLQQRLQQLESTASVMDRVSYGIWLLDGEGQVARANVAAQGLVDGQSGLRQRGQSLIAAWRPDQPSLQVAIASGITTIAARRSDILLHDAVGQPWAACTVHPLHRTTLDPVAPTTQAACILAVHPFSTNATASTITLSEVFGLTPAEAELATALLRHGSLNCCSNGSGKSYETLRTQLKALFAKTETHRQAELIRRLEAALG